MKNIIGHQRIVNQLTKRLQTAHLSHSLLFTGAEGIGKKRVAYWLAYEWLMDHREIGKPMTTPPFHPDLWVMEPEGQFFKKNQVEELLKNLGKKPFQGEKRGIIIDDFHLATPSAQNALLKTFEDPNSLQMMILITHQPGKILPTIISRAQQIHFLPPKVEDYEGLYQRDPMMIRRLIRSHRGRVEPILKSLETGEKDEHSTLVSWLATMGEGRRGQAYLISDRLAGEEQSQDGIKTIMYWCEDLIILSLGEDGPLNYPEHQEALAKQAENLTINELNKLITQIEKANNPLQFHVNQNLIWENLLDDIQEVLIK